MSMPSEIADSELRRTIAEFEALRIRKNTLVTEKMNDAIRAGRPVNPSLIDSSEKRERYLEALGWHGRLGLTPQELYDKRRAWLWRPGEKATDRPKTISQGIRRLKSAGLAWRRKEGRTYRYFISENGKRRLDYYRKVGKKEKKPETDEFEKWLYEQLELSTVMMIEMKNRHRSIEVHIQSIDPQFWGTYSLLWRRIQDLVYAILFLQYSVSYGGEKLIKYAVTESNRSLVELIKLQNTVDIVACASNAIKPQ